MSIMEDYEASKANPCISTQVVLKRTKQDGAAGEQTRTLDEGMSRIDISLLPREDLRLFLFSLIYEFFLWVLRRNLRTIPVLPLRLASR